MYGKKRHKEIRGRREEGEGNHSNPNAPMFTDELYVLMGDGKKEDELVRGWEEIGAPSEQASNVI